MYHKRHWKTRFSAFMPPPDRELSTFNVDGLTDTQIWPLGEAVRLERAVERMYGRAELPVSAVLAQDLKAIRDDNPPRHVIVVGWPTDPDPAVEKARHKLKALELARLARFIDYDPAA